MRLAALHVGVLADEVADVLQEAAVTLWRKGLRGGGIAYRVARAHAVALRRAHEGRQGQRRAEALGEWDQAGPEDAQACAMVREALRRLPARDATTAELLAGAECAQQAAQDLGVSPQAISQRAALLRQSLSRCL